MGQTPSTLTEAQLTIKSGPLELRNLLFLAARDHGVLIEELVGRSHSRRLVEVRRAFAKTARECGYSFPTIGRALNRHHTTVMNLVAT